MSSDAVYTVFYYLSNGGRRYMFNHTQFYGFGSQKPQGPPTVAFRRFPAAQDDDLRFHVPGCYRRNRGALPYLPVQHPVNPFPHILFAHPIAKGLLTMTPLGYFHLFRYYFYRVVLVQL
jgi:hypothetical protein